LPEWLFRASVFKENKCLNHSVRTMKQEHSLFVHDKTTKTSCYLKNCV